MKQRSKLVSPLRRKSSLRIEPLEDRCVPSATLPALDAGLDGDALLSEALFGADQGHKPSKGLLAALGSAPTGVVAGNATGPVTESTVSGTTAPAPKAAGVQAPPVIIEAPGATLTVNTLKDETTADNTLSLREAIQVIDAASTAGLSAAELAQISGTVGPNSTIVFATGLTGSIHLNSALPDLTSPNANNTSIQGGGAITVNAALVLGYALTIDNNVTATISGMTFTNGLGAIANRGNLTVSYSTFSYASSLGAIRDLGGTTPNLTVQSCTFTSNHNTTVGGALAGLSPDVMTISKSTFTGNSSSAGGGAIADVGLAGKLSITGSTFTGNTATGAPALGGAVLAEQGTVSITGSTTFTGNSATDGGAVVLVAETSANVTGDTFSNNIASSIGGAMFTDACTSAQIGGCAFTGNRANGGGGPGIAGAIADVSSPSLTLSNDTITGNYATSIAGGVLGQNDGLSITNTVITGNSATQEGGGLAWFATAPVPTPSLSVSNCNISGNSAGLAGGGVFLNNGSYSAKFTNCYVGNNYTPGIGGGFAITSSVVTLNTCFITNNTATVEGGGAFVTASVSTFTNSTIFGNTAKSGGGVFATGSIALLQDSTVSGNTASSNGGGAYNTGSILEVFNSTVANNTATGKGGGVYNTSTGVTEGGNATIAFNQAGTGGGAFVAAGGAFELYNTIVAQNTLVGSSTASDISGTVTGTPLNNLIGTGGAGGITNGVNGNQTNVATPLLGNLANNGGPTQTIMLEVGSPAIGNGNVGKAPTFGATDQRGLTRIVGGKVDIGAVEVQPAGTATHFVTQIAPKVSLGIATNVKVTVEDDFGTVITGFTGTVTFTSSDTAATLGAAALPASYTFTSTDAGVHVFSVTFNTLGTQSLTITDAADKLSGISFTDVIPVPARGCAFIDGINQLWVFENGQFTNTGGFAKVFSAGVDAAGKAEVWFLDGNNQLWKWDNGVFTNTGGFALHIAAGEGCVAFSDGLNELFIFSDASGFKNTGGFASRFTAGFDINGNTQVVFADGINQLWTYNVTTNTFHNTGGFTKLFTAGQDAFGNNEIWFTDGNNQIWRLDNGVFHKTSGFALTITGSANGTMYFSDGINQIWQLTDFGVFTNTGGFASHISGSPGTTALFFSDGINQLWEFFNGTFTNTGGFASNFSAF
jgi:hypothetical protein